MTEKDLSAFAKGLKERAYNRRIWAEGEQITAYRLFDREKSLPLAIDIFNGKYLHITHYAGDEPFEINVYLDVISRALAIESGRIFYKERSKLKDKEQYTKQAGDSFTLWIEENGLQFLINLSDYIDYGLFLNQRLSRRLIADYALNKKVLNLFSYTGSFGLYAAFAGAGKVVNVDTSNTYLDWAKENMRQNNLLTGHTSFVRADAVSFLAEAKTNKDKYDIIILDPPVFSNNKSGVLNLQRDYAKLINDSLVILNKGGFVFFSTSLTNFDFTKHQINGKANEVTNKTIPLDFVKPHRAWVISH
ncbi:MAG: class I SAM-dependent methyltransferase [Spirochaetaceae bacterium]|nr:class I SAM-dependent methyltransferase [Spirochaetaceae bacterium]